MGIVFLATDTTLDRRVAIKAVHPELAAHQSIGRRFLAEARTIARLRHPNIVAVHTAGNADGLLYYVMDEVEGESLQPAARPRAAARPGHGRPDRGRPGRGARRRRPGRRGPPRREAGERAARPGHRPGDAGRLRHRARDGGRERHQQHGAGSGRRHAGLHEPRAGRRRGDRRPERRLRARRRRLRDARRRAAVLGAPTAWSSPSTSPSGRRRSSASGPETPRPLAAAIMRALEKQPADRWQTGEAFRQALLTEQPAPRPGRAGAGAWSWPARRSRSRWRCGRAGLLNRRSPGPPSGVNPRHSILVLPFDNLRDDRAVDWLRDGSVSMLGLNLSPVERPHRRRPRAAARSLAAHRAPPRRRRRARPGAAAGARGRRLDRGARRLHPGGRLAPPRRRGYSTSRAASGWTWRGWTTGAGVRRPADVRRSRRQAARPVAARRTRSGSASPGAPPRRSRRTAPTWPAWSSSTAGTWPAPSASSGARSRSTPPSAWPTTSSRSPAAGWWARATRPPTPRSSGRRPTRPTCRRTTAPSSTPIAPSSAASIADGAGRLPAAPRPRRRRRRRLVRPRRGVVPRHHRHATRRRLDPGDPRLQAHAGARPRLRAGLRARAGDARHRGDAAALLRAGGRRLVRPRRRPGRPSAGGQRDHRRGRGPAPAPRRWPPRGAGSTPSPPRSAPTARWWTPTSPRAISARPWPRWTASGRPRRCTRSCRSSRPGSASPRARWSAPPSELRTALDTVAPQDFRTYQGTPTVVGDIAAAANVFAYQGDLAERRQDDRPRRPGPARGDPAARPRAPRAWSNEAGGGWR